MVSNCAWTARLGGFSAGELRFIECRADEKVVFEDFFEGGWAKPLAPGKFP